VNGLVMARSLALRSAAFLLGLHLPIFCSNIPFDALYVPALKVGIGLFAQRKCDKILTVLQSA